MRCSMMQDTFTDSKGNTLNFRKQIPSFGLDLTVTSKDGKQTQFLLEGDNLRALAMEIGQAAITASKVRAS